MLLAAALAKLERLDEAKASAARVTELQPGFRYSRQLSGVHCSTTLAVSLGEALRKTGLPERATRSLSGHRTEVRSLSIFVCSACESRHEAPMSTFPGSRRHHGRMRAVEYLAHISGPVRRASHSAVLRRIATEEVVVIGRNCVGVTTLNKRLNRRSWRPPAAPVSRPARGPWCRRSRPSRPSASRAASSGSRCRSKNI
jgi:hypothetical protein